ncbi:nicotinate phosphoribosyltransferase [Leifsonia aquatica]|uniref:nicotinate phosphoribosyltransferase n=1 Tax=Leifsonia aquatica TaxID=144185 RepID=UPI000A9F0AF3|nr:nicotinate phosphoribosyltransferase [Leifsonia aquatica]
MSAIAPLLETDAYKLDHRRQYPAGTSRVYSNFTNRGSRIPGVTHVVHFGLQAFLQRYLMDGFKAFFAADEDAVALAYERAVASILGPNDVGSDHIRALHQLGHIPLRFAAVPEGTPVPLRVPSFTVENTHPDFFWLTNYIETVLSASVWGPSTSATIAREYRKVLDDAAERTGGSKEAVDFQLHDFSYRGMPGTEAAAASGAGHLLSFKGSDSLASLEWIDTYYGDNPWRTDLYPSHTGLPNGLILGSVPATEHSVMCAGGQDDEEETYERLLELYPSGIVSIVSDTWDLWHVVMSILPRLRHDIMQRDGKVVIRPDSGDPADIICGTRRTKRGYNDAAGTPEEAGLIELLWEIFGGTTVKGLKVLDPHIGAIYGDSITIDRARDIIERLEAKGFAPSNIVFGVGSYTYQYVTRDTFGSAIKATYVVVDGEGRNIQKAPKTDNGLKKSATGRLAVVRSNGELTLIQEASPALEAVSELQPVWEDGQFITYQSFADVRRQLALSTDG